MLVTSPEEIAARRIDSPAFSTDPTMFMKYSPLPWGEGFGFGFGFRKPRHGDWAASKAQLFRMSAIT